MSDTSSKTQQTYDPLAAAPLPRRLTKRGWIVLAVALGVLAVAWLIVFANYKVAGTSEGEGGDVPLPAEGVVVLIEPLRFEPGDNQMTARLQFAVTGALENPSDGSLTEDIIVAVGSESGVQEVTLPKGRQPASQEVRIGTQGNYATYPLDNYVAEFQVIADAVTRDAGGQVTEKASLPLITQVEGTIDAWNIQVQSLTAEPAEVADGTLALDRSGNTLLFAFFLLALMTVLVALALVVATLSYTNRRRIEVDLLGWFAGLLFALPFLRQIFPGAPPVGAAMDVYVFLWLLALAMVAAVMVVVGWLQQNKAELLAERQDEDGSAESDLSTGAPKTGE